MAMPETPDVHPEGPEGQRGTTRGRVVAAAVAVVVIVLAAVAAWGMFRDKGDEVVLPPATLASPPGPCDFTDPTVIPVKKVMDAPPKMQIDPAARYTAEVNTSCGTMKFKLLPKLAPVTVNNFVFLARQHYYNGILFHRLADSLDIIQAGDPVCMTDEVACGSGTPGYRFADELTGKEKYRPGVVAMANQGKPDTNGSQFFIVTGPEAMSLPPKYTIFGQLADEQSLEVAQTIQSLPTRAREDAPPGAEPEMPVDRVWIRGVKISEEKG